MKICRYPLSCLCVVAFASMTSPLPVSAQTFPTWQGTGTNSGDAANLDAAYAHDQLEWTDNRNQTSWNNLSIPQSQWRFFFSGSQSYTLGGSDVHFWDFGSMNRGILRYSPIQQTVL